MVTGFAAIADAWACTNPSAGRGLTVGLLHARELRDAIREAGDDPAGLVRRFDERTEANVTPWYTAQIAVDRARFAEMEALREGRTPAPPEGLGAAILALFALMPFDPELFRATLEYVSTITPAQEIVQRPEIAARMHATREALKDAPSMPLPGPTRQQLLDLVH